MSDNELYEKAVRRADDKIGFYKHLCAFIVVNLFFFILNAVTSFGDWWFYWITGLWAIGLIFHFFRAFVFTGNIEDNRDKMIEKEMEKLKK